jgi:hypothetical protein
VFGLSRCTAVASPLPSRHDVRAPGERLQEVVTQPVDQARIFQKMCNRGRAGMFDQEPIGKDVGDRLPR